MSVIETPNNENAIHVQENVTTEGQKLVGHLRLHHAPIHPILNLIPPLHMMIIKRYGLFAIYLLGLGDTDGAKVKLTHVKRIQAQYSQLILLVFHH